MPQVEEFQKVHEALRARLENHIPLRDPQEHPDAVEGRNSILERFGNNSMSCKYISLRGRFGEGRISIIELAVPVSRNTCLIGAEMGEVQKKMVDDLVASRKVKPGCSP